MTKALDLAISKIAALPEEVQDQIGRKLLLLVETTSQLRDEIAVGICEQDAGKGQELDVDVILPRVHNEYEKSYSTASALFTKGKGRFVEYLAFLRAGRVTRF